MLTWLRWGTILSFVFVLMTYMGGRATVWAKDVADSLSQERQLNTDSSVEIGFTVWNWTAVYQDINLFKETVDKLVEMGFNTLEIAVPWGEVEFLPGKFDFSKVEERFDYALAKGLHVRARLNVHYSWPSFGVKEFLRMSDGSIFNPGGFPSCVPSFFNDETLENQLRFAQRLARRFAGRGVEYSPGIGLHFEVKYADWNSYDPSAKEKYRKWLADKYGSIDNLNLAWQSAYGDFTEVEPVVPGATPRDYESETPDLSMENLDWIAFREEYLAHVAAKFIDVIRSEDPGATFSVPLGEGVRSAGAQMGNLDYFGLSQHADKVVHSWDFGFHGAKELWWIAAAMETMRGITQKPVVFEIDGSWIIQKFGEDGVVELGIKALTSGAAGLNICNYDYEVATHGVDVLDKFQFIGRLIQYIQGNEEMLLAQRARLEQEPAILFYLPKWQYYAYRNDTEWMRDYQYLFYMVLHELGYPVRFISDGNLLCEDVHDLADNVLLVLPYAVVIPEEVRPKLEELLTMIPALQDTVAGQYSVGQRSDQWFGDAFGVEPLDPIQGTIQVVSDGTIVPELLEGEYIDILSLYPNDALVYPVTPGLDSVVLGQIEDKAVMVASSGENKKFTFGFGFSRAYARRGNRDVLMEILTSVLKWLTE